MVFVPVMVRILVRMNHHYEREHEELDEGLEPFGAAPSRRPVAVVSSRTSTARRSTRSSTRRRSRAPTHAVHVETSDETEALRRRWAELGIDVPLVVLRTRATWRRRSPATPRRSPATPTSRSSSRPGRWEVRATAPRPDRARIARALAPAAEVRVTLVRDHPESHGAAIHTNGSTAQRVLPRPVHRAVVLVDRADRAALQAVRYALSLGTDEVMAVHAAVEPEVPRTS